MEEKEYKVFTVAIEKKDIKSAESTIALIQKFVCAERKVPYQLFNKLLDILTTETSLESKYYSERANSIALLANQYFSSYKDYDFNGLTKNQIRQFPEPNFDGMTQSDYDKLLKPIKKEYVPYSLREMCLYALKEYEGFVNLSSNKGKAVRFLYKNVCAYSERFSGKHKKEFTEYKKGVIVAFLINELDLIKPKIEPHNQTLYDKIKKDLKSNKATI